MGQWVLAVDVRVRAGSNLPRAAALSCRLPLPLHNLCPVLLLLDASLLLTFPETLQSQLPKLSLPRLAGRE